MKTVHGGDLMRFIKWLVAIVLVAVVLVVIGRLVWPLPDISDRPAETALPADRESPVYQVAEAGLRANPDRSGVIALANGSDALASRLALIAQARSSIDAQYYIWHDDVSGLLLLDALKQAAERGVKVRLLLDDNGVPGLDAIMATLDAQPNFDIRLFNPSTVRNPKIIGYAIDFFRMNRRMHNKSMIVDGAAAIIGGRNIGDEYFQIGDQFYVDLDVLALGQVVADTSAAFDLYWNSASVFALEDIITLPPDLPAFEDRAAEMKTSPELAKLQTETADSVQQFLKGQLQPEWTSVQLVVDDPIKGQGKAEPDQLMIVRLKEIMGEVTTRLDLVSAYFVPGKAGTKYFNDLAQSGDQVNILTNALNTTDVLLVHAGYTKYRRELLQGGVHLFELKLRGGQPPVEDKQIKPFGLSGASLHAKTFAVDGQRIFIGSFNFDPRSALLNCEMGFLIESPSMATRVHTAFDEKLASVSYQPELTPEGKMIWHEPIGPNETRTYQEEPGAAWAQQIMLTIIGVLPVEWML